MRLLLFFLGTLCAPAEDLELPTPLEHYQTYDWEADARALLLELAADVPAETQARALALTESASPDEVRALLDSIDWKKHRPRLESILLHGSRVLEVVPEEASSWLPLIHDSLLLFLDRMSDERFIGRIVAQAHLPKDASRGQRALAFIIEAPSLQKLAQILARNPSLAPDFGAALQTLENGLSTARYEEVMESIERELPPATEEEYDIEFRDRLLAEASVGAVVEASYRMPGTESGARAACKVLKPGAVTALAEDLKLIDRVLAYLEDHAEFYEIGESPLVDIFEEIREALSHEVQVAAERRNLIRAREYYRDAPGIQVPEVLPFSTTNVTCMEFIEGVKITDAFPGKAEERARLARRLSDALTYDVIFSKSETALFHGDPHAGNVFSAPARGVHPDPYRIALIDWGLAAEFTEEQREMLVQLILGLYLKDPGRLGEHLGVLADLDSADEDDLERIRESVAGMVARSGSEGMFPLLDELVTELARQGWEIRYQAAIFIKSQLTIAGILKELDPEFEQDDHVMGRVRGQVYRELPTRLLRTVWFPAWNSHDYRSLMSNEDVKDVQWQRTRGFFAKVGKGIWIGVSFQWLF
ncbi:MAG: AarF/UbiB family protein [Vicinamibacteria bacterium]